MSNEFSKEQLVDLYDEHGSVSAVARELGASYKSVASAMRRFGIEYSKSPRKYTVNHTFFSSVNDSEASFYWAGFLAANGNVATHSGKDRTYRIFVNMSIRDKPYLKKMAEAMGSDVPVYERWVKYKNKPYLVSRVLINSKYLIEDLSRFNVLPRKTYTYKMPLWLLNHSMVRHFLRGWVDGKGGIYQKTETKRVFRTSGTTEFLEQFKDVVSANVGLYEHDRPVVPTTKTMGRIEYIEDRDISAISHWLYDHATHCLDWKRDVALFGAPLQDEDFQSEG